MATERNLVLENLTVNGTATINGDLIIKGSIVKYTTNSNNEMIEDKPIGTVIKGKWDKKDFVDKISSITEKETKEEKEKFINSNYWTELFTNEKPLTKGTWLCEISIRLAKVSETGLSSQVCLINAKDREKLIAQGTEYTGSSIEPAELEKEQTLIDKIITLSNTKAFNSLYTPKGYVTQHNLTCFLNITEESDFIVLMNTSVSAEIDSQYCEVKFTKIL